MNMSLFPQWILVSFPFVSVIVSIVIQVAFAIAVFADAGRLPNARRTVFVGPVIWFLATLFGGVFTAAMYWIMHHSMLCSSVAHLGSEENR